MSYDGPAEDLDLSRGSCRSRVLLTGVVEGLAGSLCAEVLRTKELNEYRLGRFSGQIACFLSS